MTKTPFHDDFYIFKADKGKIFTDENNTRYGTMVVAERIGKIIEIDDTVIAAVNNSIVKGTVVKLTNRSVKIAESGKEYTVTINRNDFKEISGERRPFFAKVVKVDRDSAGSTLEPGSNVAYLEIDFGTCTGFGFGTVSRISPSYVYINNDNGEELRKSIGKVSTV